MGEAAEAYVKEHPFRNRAKKAAAATTALLTFAASDLSNPGSTEVTTNKLVGHTIEHKTITDAYPEIYARLFSDDPEAGKLVDPQAVIEEYNKLDNLFKAGYKTDQPGRNVGVSSDDDDKTAINGIRTGGIGVDSEKNVKLGDVRGTVFKKMFDKVFEEHGMTPPEMNVYGAEAVLGKEATADGQPIMNLDTKAIKADVNFMQKIAKQNGISMGDLLDRLNGIVDEPPPASEKLDSVFKRLFIDKREVIITFKLSKEDNNVVTIVHKTHLPGAWFAPIGDLTEVYAPKKPKKGNNTPFKSDIKAQQGYGRIMAHDKRPRPHNEGDRQRKTHNSRNRGGSTGRPTNTKFKGSRRGN